MLETICGDGSVLPPMVIYKEKALYEHWYQQLTDVEREAVFCHSRKGWTNQILGVKYLELLFDPITLRNCKEKDWRLLMVDGHNSHFSTEFIQYCESHQIELFCIPPHTTHILQPLDVGLFSPLQHHYSKGIENHMRCSEETINKANFLP